MSRRVRIGIIGTGGIVQELHLPVLLQLPEVEVVWLFDQVKERASQLREAFKIAHVAPSIEDAPEVDAVLVAVPVGYRGEILERVAKRGFHIFCEKPFATSTEELERYLEIAADAKVQIGVALMRRFYAGSGMARKIVASGAFGPLQAVFAGEGSRMAKTGRGGGWYQSDKRAAGGGILLETGSHLVDQACWIVGALGFEMIRAEQFAVDGIDYDMRAELTIQNSSTTHIPFELALSRTDEVENGIFLKFETATLQIGLSPDKGVTIFTPDGAPLADLYVEMAGATNLYQAFAAEWRSFLSLAGFSGAGFRPIDTDPLAAEVRVECGKVAAKIIDACYAHASSATQLRAVRAQSKL